MYNFDRLACLRFIRLAFIRCSRYDDIPDAALHGLAFHLETARSLAGLRPVSTQTGHRLDELCIATGCILYFDNRKVQSVPVARMRQEVLLQVQHICQGSVSPGLATCLGAIVSVLLQGSEANQRALRWSKCISAALAACIFLQVSRGLFHAEAILMYSSSISVAFAACVFEAETGDDLCHCMQPLLCMVARLCSPNAGSTKHECVDEWRPKLQRLTIPVVLQIAQRLDQLQRADLSHCGSLPLGCQEPQGLKQTMPAMQGMGHAFLTEGTNACATMTAAADAAQLLAMVYIEESKANGQELSQCISKLLRVLRVGPTPTVLIAQRIPIPSEIQHLQSSHGVRRSINGTESCVKCEKSCTDEASLFEHCSGTVSQYLLPALNSPGHWMEAATFMLTLLQSCIPRPHVPSGCSLDIDEEQILWWDKLILLLQPILAALAMSTRQQRIAIEVIICIVNSCPNSCEAKQAMCLDLVGCLMFWGMQTETDISTSMALADMMRGIASSYMCPNQIADVCKTCTAIGCSNMLPCSKVSQAVVALTMVVVHGPVELMDDLLGMAEKVILRIDSPPLMSSCLRAVRSILDTCHDVRKKPHCVRWYHRQVYTMKALQPH